MKNRCTNPNNSSYKNYGGRGITICDEWKEFINFKEDMEESYFEGASIERVDNNKGYSPENCVWADSYRQANNRRNNTYLVYNGKKMTIPQWARELGIKRSTLSMRFYSYNWSVEETLTGKRG